MFKLNAKSDADSLLYLLSHFWCVSHTVHMLTQQYLPPPLTSAVKLSLFRQVHSSPLSLAARLHWCCANSSYYINNGWTFSGHTVCVYISVCVYIYIYTHILYIYYIYIYIYIIHTHEHTLYWRMIFAFTLGDTKTHWRAPSTRMTWCNLYLQNPLATTVLIEAWLIKGRSRTTMRSITGERWSWVNWTTVVTRWLVRSNEILNVFWGERV